MSSHNFKSLSMQGGLPLLAQSPNHLPSNPGRSSLFHSPIHAFGLLKYDSDQLEGAEVHDDHANRASVIQPTPASKRDLMRFHDEAFVRHKSIVYLSVELIWQVCRLMRCFRTATARN